MVVSCRNGIQESDEFLAGSVEDYGFVTERIQSVAVFHLELTGREVFQTHIAHVYHGYV